jgi:hypothetical protein
MRHDTGYYKPYPTKCMNENNSIDAPALVMNDRTPQHPSIRTVYGLMAPCDGDCDEGRLCTRVS